MKVPAIWFDFGAATPRFAIAPPGIDASTAADSALLLSLGLRPAQIVQAGQVYVAVGVGAVVTWPAALPAPPAMEIETSYETGRMRVPYHRRSSGATGISVAITTTGATFAATTTSRWVNYVALAKSV